MNCPHCQQELGFKIPLVRDGHLWRCRLCNYKTEEEKADESTEQQNAQVVQGMAE